MYARTVRMQLKPNSVAAFTRTLANTIMPLLRTQPGFQDEIACVVPGGTEGVRVRVWDDNTPGEASPRGTSPAVLQAVAQVMEGTPQVRLEAVSHSTFHRLIARVALGRGEVVCVVGAATSAIL
jgi:hypothetical protein